MADDAKMSEVITIYMKKEQVLFSTLSAKLLK